MNNWATTMMFDKSYIFFAYILALVSGEPVRKGLIQNAVDFCAMERGFPANKYENFVSNYMNVELDDCVAACAMRRLGTMSDSGTFTGEEAKNLMVKSEAEVNEDAEMDAAIDSCAKMYGDGPDPCTTVRNLQACYKILFVQIQGNHWSINGFVNQALLLTFENYPDSYPGGKGGASVNNTEVVLKLLP
ncbi:uncharacterized protein LOC135160799 isoform X2 [Diachasmimorpha longicaudata]|uniref:uncharacterized protein LOC135160799 isoform X2 n=1 Tax=Diachasmimorpha longicaudata TaxID=58733 RepID=UPI0030B89FFA